MQIMGLSWIVSECDKWSKNYTIMSGKSIFHIHTCLTLLFCSLSPCLSHLSLHHHCLSDRRLIRFLSLWIRSMHYVHRWSMHYHIRLIKYRSMVSVQYRDWSHGQSISSQIGWSDSYRRSIRSSMSWLPIQKPRQRIWKNYSIFGR